MSNSTTGLPLTSTWHHQKPHTTSLHIHQILRPVPAVIHHAFAVHHLLLHHLPHPAFQILSQHLQLHLWCQVPPQGTRTDHGGSGFIPCGVNPPGGGYNHASATTQASTHPLLLHQLCLLSSTLGAQGPSMLVCLTFLLRGGCCNREI